MWDNEWHKVQIYTKLNTTSGSTTNADGILKYWLDGDVIFNMTDLVMRTSNRPNIKYDKFVIVPYIGAGSPIAQTMWVDDITVADGLGTVNDITSKGMTCEGCNFQ